MKSNRYLIIALVMLIGGAILLFPVRYLQPYTSWQQAYEGREVFYTEQEYSEFKQVVVDFEVPLRDIKVLNSQPPIVVEFGITITGLLDNNEEIIAIKKIPYGQATREEPVKLRSRSRINVLGFIIGLSLMLFSMVPFTKDSEEN